MSGGSTVPLTAVAFSENVSELGAPQTFGGTAGALVPRLAVSPRRERKAQGGRGRLVN